MPRPPKPARLKLVEGRSPGRDSGGRKVPESPKFIRQAPDAPDWLDAEALAEWRRVAPTLERLDLLKPEDRALLSAYCETWSVYVAAVQRVRAEGLTITSPKSGVVHRNPAVTVAETARMHLLRLASEFGLTPAAEQRLAVAPGDDGDGLNPFAPDRCLLCVIQSSLASRHPLTPGSRRGAAGTRIAAAMRHKRFRAFLASARWWPNFE